MDNRFAPPPFAPWSWQRWQSQLAAHPTALSGQRARNGRIWGGPVAWPFLLHGQIISSSIRLDNLYRAHYLLN